MKTYLLFVLLTLTGCRSLRPNASPQLPSWMKGNFTDDYGIKYSISDSLFTLGSSAKYHILDWNDKQQYLLVKNDINNPTEKGLYTRIDYMPFTGMEPYNWGFCLTKYDAPTASVARKATAADRSNPKKGCNSFPFSRMKKVEGTQAEEGGKTSY